MGPNISGPMEFQRLSSGQNAEKTIMAKIFFTLKWKILKMIIHNYVLLKKTETIME